MTKSVRISPAGLDGEVRLASGKNRALIVFAHGSGSSRHSPRNQFVADRLLARGLATLLFDLLTPAEDQDRAARFDIALLARRLGEATAWIRRQPDLASFPIGYFGASTGAAAALVASTQVAGCFAVVSRGGRPDLAGDALRRVTCPTLLLVGELDFDVLALNRRALGEMHRGDARLVIVPGATHLFEEPGTLGVCAEAAADWFVGHVPGRPIARAS